MPNQRKQATGRSAVEDINIKVPVAAPCAGNAVGGADPPTSTAPALSVGNWFKPFLSKSLGGAGLVLLHLPTM
jgi:hypothetical protein